MSAGAAVLASSLAAAVPQGRVGPNAITRVAEVLRAEGGEALAEAVFRAAGLMHHLVSPPGDMVDEAEVARLHAAVHHRFGPTEAERMGRAGGALTAAYLLAHRIPKPVQVLLKLMPAGLAARVLSGAITRHAWTFAGSGRFTVTPGRPTVVTIEGCPLCRDLVTDGPACAFYAATFEGIFRALVDPRVTVTETSCAAAGAPACVFEIAW